MTWINLPEQTILDLIIAVDQHAINSVGTTTIETYEGHSRTLRALLTPDPEDARFYEAATALGGPHRLSEPDHYENPPFVSRGDDGAYVMGWIWVSNKDAGIRDIEIAIYPMKKAADGDGHTLADSDDEAIFWDVQVKERDDDEIEIIDEVENLPTREAADLVAQAFEAKYPDAWTEQ